MKRLTVLLIALFATLGAWATRECVNNKMRSVEVTTTSQIVCAPRKAGAPTYSDGTVTLASSTAVLWSNAYMWGREVVTGKIFSANQDTTASDDLDDWFYVTAVPIRLTPATVEIADVFTAIVDGNTATFTATAGTVANVTAGLTAAINALIDSRGNAIEVTASDQTTYIQLTHDVGGESFSLTASTTDGGGADTQTMPIASYITLDRAYDDPAGGGTGAGKAFTIGIPATVCYTVLYDQATTDGNAYYKMVDGPNVPSTTDGTLLADQTYYTEEVPATGVLLWALNATVDTVDALDVDFHATDIQSP